MQHAASINGSAPSPRECRTRTTGKRYLTSEDAAAYLGLNHRTVTRWAREGYLPAIPMGEGKKRLWRFLEDDLDDWMYGRRQAGYSAADADNHDYTGRSHRCSHPGD